MNPIMRYADLRLALHWAEEANESIKDETDYHLQECVKITYGYLKSYCKSINLEEK